jgi:hypothetical protein
MRTVAAGLVLALALAGPARAQVLLYAPDKGIMPAVVLDDQFDRCHTAAALRGDVVVLVYGDRTAGEASKALAAELHAVFHPAPPGLPPAEARKAPVRPVECAPRGARSPDVHVVPVACVGEVPGFTRGAIRAAFRASSPDLPIWLDFQDQVRNQCGFTAGVPNVAILDTAGRLRCLAAGPLAPDQVAHLTGLIEGLRREAVQPGR